jgi:hypothetical protein
MFRLGAALTSLTVRRRNSAFSMAGLFRGGRKGIWLDPSDLSTMFQDLAQTSPVTAPGQTVMVIRDKSGNNSHATQSGASTVRPVYGFHPMGGQRQLLIWSGLDGATSGGVAPTLGWTRSSGTGTQQPTVAADATLGGNSIVASCSSLRWVLTSSPAVAIPANSTLVFSIVANITTVGTQTLAQMVTWLNGPAGSTITYKVNGSAANSGDAPPLANGVIIECVLTSAGTSGNANPTFGVGVVSNTTGTTKYRDPQAEFGNTRTTYQRSWSVYESKQSGVSDAHYLQFDGSNDALVTPSIDFTATDEIFVCAGLNKLKNTPLGVVAELSTSSQTGTFSIFTPGSAGGNYGFRVRGSVSVLADGPANSFTGTNGNTINVFTGSGDISADTSELRIDGTVSATVSTDHGTGNLINAPIYIGARAGTTSAANVRLYGLVIRGGTRPNTATRLATEAFMRGKCIASILLILAIPFGFQLVTSGDDPAAPQVASIANGFSVS